jgi:hypothetical protein
MEWSDLIANARNGLITAAARKEHAIADGIANEYDIDRRIAHMRAITRAYLALMMALMGNLNDNVPATERVPLEDFRDHLSDAFADTSGAFRCIADRLIVARPTPRHAS